MKRLNVFILILIALVGCKNANETKNAPTTTEVIKPPSKLQLHQDGLEILLNELLEFKDVTEFHNLGFKKQGTKYFGWMKRVLEFLDNPLTPYIQSEHIEPSAVKGLGYEYYNSKGKETSYSNITVKKFREGFIKGVEDISNLEELLAEDQQEKVDKIEQEKQEALDKELEEKNLVGKWKVKNSLAPSLSHIFLISHDSKFEYYGKRLIYGKVQHVFLDKVKNIYKDKYSSFGEYYIVDKNGDLLMYDKDGIIGKSSGYSTTQIK